VAVLNLEVATAQGVRDVDEDFVGLEGFDDVALSPNVPLDGWAHYTLRVVSGRREGEPWARRSTPGQRHLVCSATSSPAPNRDRRTGIRGRDDLHPSSRPLRQQQSGGQQSGGQSHGTLNVHTSLLR
jgi:hypothetical protein